MFYRTIALRREIRKSRRHDPEVIAWQRRTRLAELVAHARAHSPHYRELYRDLPAKVTDPSLLPVSNKQTLMADFDNWVTVPDLTLAKVQGFTADPARIGERLDGKYTVVTTSGTTGNPGIFVVDDEALAVNFALNAGMMGSWLGAGGMARALSKGARMAFIVATGGHFLANVGAVRMRDSRFGHRVKILSVHTPLPELVAELNRFRPAIVLGYSSVLTQLTSEQLAGRLHIDPVLMQPAGEGLPAATMTRIAETFGATVRDTYGCGECPFLSTDCPRGWYHVNSDWAIVEAVDEQYRPVPAGQPSHTVLITNLANRIQPILRYNLGDSVTMREGPCPCGNPRPALRVRGRSSTSLTLPKPDGTNVTLTSMMIGTIIDGVRGIEVCQVIQTAPDRLAVRMRAYPDAEDITVWHQLQRDLATLLTRHGLANVKVDRDLRSPRRAAGGKYRTIIPLEVRPPTAVRDKDRESDYVFTI